MTLLVATLTMDPQGKPVSCRPLPGPWLGFFAPTAVEFGMRWTFRSAEQNGKSPFVRFRMTLPFRLQ